MNPTAVAANPLRRVLKDVNAFIASLVAAPSAFVAKAKPGFFS
jgi:hypothetical protein